MPYPHMTSTKLFSSALVDLGLDTEDPGLAPPGARCGEAGLCEHQECVPLEDVLVPCPYLCSGHGACDNTRTCHCDPGWTGATCNVSRDSVTILVTVMTSITLLLTCCLLLLRRYTIYTPKYDIKLVFDLTLSSFNLN